MKLRTGLIAFAAVVSGQALFAQEPVVGKPDESLFTDTDPVLHRNKQATLHIMRELLQCGQWDRSGEWLTDAYHQHNPNAASGREGVVYFFTQVMKQPRIASCDKLTTEIVAVTATMSVVSLSQLAMRGCFITCVKKYTSPSRPEAAFGLCW